MTVYGLGRRNTPEPFVAACDRFIYFDLLSPDTQQPTVAVIGDEEPAPRRPNLETGSVVGDQQHVQGRWLVEPGRGWVVSEPRAMRRSMRAITGTQSAVNWSARSPTLRSTRCPGQRASVSCGCGSGQRLPPKRDVDKRSLARRGL